MFYLLDLERELEVQPRFLGPKFREEVTTRLRQEVEGTCSGHYGYVLAVIDVQGISRGLIREGLGSAVFKVAYRCMTFMPHKDEVLDAVVKSVNKMGFFAEAGPVTCFISNHLIPEEFEFDTAHDPCYTTPSGDSKIEAGAEVRLRIVGTKVDANEIFAVASIAGDFLGVIG